MHSWGALAESMEYTDPKTHQGWKGTLEAIWGAHKTEGNRLLSLVCVTGQEEMVSKTRKRGNLD